MFAILGRTYETNLTCCLWNASGIISNLKKMSRKTFFRSIYQGTQISLDVFIFTPGPMVDAVTQDLMYWPFAAAGLALMIAPMSAL